MNDRKPLIAIALILLIAIVPSFLIRRPPPKPATVTPTASAPTPVDTGVPQATAQQQPVIGSFPGTIDSTLPPEKRIVVRSPLYRYELSTLGGRITSAKLLHYQSMAPADTTDAGKRDTLELITSGDALLAGRLVSGTDSVRLDRGAFTASVDSLTVTDSADLVLTGRADGHDVSLRYHFVADDYRIGIDGQIGGLGPVGGTLLMGLGMGLRHSEATPLDNLREAGVVTKSDRTQPTRFGQMKPLAITTLSGPFEWVAVKSKYFVAGFFAYDSTGPNSFTGRVGGLVAQVPDTFKTPVRATVQASMAIPQAGGYHATLYLGPMEYDRLKHMGHEFDDVNPYGWSWLRGIIRPFVVAIRFIFVWMHHNLGLGYGLVIVAFGILMRVLLWPLNSKAYRSMAAMTAIQPQVQALQERYKEDPAKLQQEMLQLYRTNKVNPLGGCWPMMLPYPLLVAVYFVLASTIEVRGVSFLWLADLSRADPYFIIPVIMAGSMFLVSKIGQMGMPLNPQAKMMMYVMPGMMLFLFARFASGLNLYYAVQNIASLPQQWMIMQERRKMMGATAAAPTAGKRKT